MKVKVNVDGETHELDASDVQVEGGQLLAEGESPDGYVTREFMQDEIKRRGKGLHSKDELAKDDEFFREVASQRGIELDEEGNPVGSEDVDVEGLRSRIKREEVEPVVERAETAEERAKRLLKASREWRLKHAARNAGFKKNLAGKFANLHAQEFDFDDESEDFALREGDGFAYSANPDKGSRHVTPDEFFKSLAQSDDYKEFVEDNRATSTGNPGGGAGGENTLSRDQFDKLSPKEQQAHFKGGGKVVDSN